MKKLNTTYLDNLVTKLLNETLEEKADKLVSRINELGNLESEDDFSEDEWIDVNELGEESHGYDEQYPLRHYMGDNPKMVANKNKDTEEDTEEDKPKSSFIRNIVKSVKDGVKKQFGEGEVGDFPKHQAFDYVEEEESDEEKPSYVKQLDAGTCQYHMDAFGADDEETIKACKSEMTETLKGNKKVLDKNKNKRNDNEDLKGRKVLDKNKNGKIDAEDFELLRKGVKNESVCPKCGMKDCKCNHKKTTKESIKLTESEMVNLIEKIILEQKTQNNISFGTSKGYDKYKQVHVKSGKENEDSLKATSKKMREYTKPGSKGEYTENPTDFPKNNGEFEKMAAKKYTMSDAGKEFVDDFMRPGMENLDYDEIHPNEEWIEKTIDGSSQTGNSSEYANAVKTDVNSNILKKQKANKFAKAKRMVANKAVQPVVSDKTGNESGKGINIKLESMNDKTKTQLNEEFSKINLLMSYNRKTQ